MLYVATVHYASPMWTEVQTRYLRRHISVPCQLWASFHKVSHEYARHFDRVVESAGAHAGKLNHLALEISHEAADSDLIMFLDGDAFPIADPLPLINDGLAMAPLIAVRRAENNNDPQPHPCFCVTTVGAWRELGGDWTGGHTWPNAAGRPTSDVGGNLLRRLELSGTPWVPVLRSNARNLNPVSFGVYGDVIYHHGGGFRIGALTRGDNANQPRARPAPAPLRPLARKVYAARWRRWETRTRKELSLQSHRIYDRIQRDDAAWLAEFIDEPAGAPQMLQPAPPPDRRSHAVGG
jgi:hypothetical protein